MPHPSRQYYFAYRGARACAYGKFGAGGRRGIFLFGAASDACGALLSNEAEVENANRLEYSGRGHPAPRFRQRLALFFPTVAGARGRCVVLVWREEQNITQITTNTKQNANKKISPLTRVTGFLAN